MLRIWAANLRSQAVAAPWIGRSAVRWVMLLTALSSTTRSSAEPVPVVRDAGGNWVQDYTGTFPISSLTLDLRRFAKLPNEGAARPGVLSLRKIEGDDRLFVVAGVPGSTVYAISPDGVNVSTIFTPRPAGFRSLSDLAFHPQFYQVGTPGYGKLYTIQNFQKPTDTTGLPYIGISTPPYGDGVLTEWNATFDAQGLFNGVDANSVREVFRIAQFSGDHPIGQAEFNPFAQPGDEDYGLIYVSHGDSYEFLNGYYAAQSGDTGLGKMIRVDPLQDGAARYSIPDTNPFLDDPAIADEIYTIGHRNNHNFSFAQDDEGNVHILVAEIGENRVEEVNLIRTSGGNYGWSDRQGTLDYPPGHSGNPSDDFIYPVAQYGHGASGRHAVAGGYVVDNGSRLDGLYFMADFPTSGKAFTFAFKDALNAVTTGDPADLDPVDVLSVNVRFDHDDNSFTPLVASTLRDIIVNEASYDGSGRLDVRFGQGPGGELYVLNKRNGWIYEVTNSIDTHPADFDFDYDVDAGDFAIWKAGFGVSNVGDTNGNGRTGGGDFLTWQRSLGTVPDLEASSAPVPEPATMFGIAAAVYPIHVACRRHMSRKRT